LTADEIVVQVEQTGKFPGEELGEYSHTTDMTRLLR